MRAEHVGRAEAVERADDLHVEILGEPCTLGLVALAVHHERPGEVAPRRVADRADRVAEPAHRLGARRRGAGAAVAVEDDHRRLGAGQLRRADRRRRDAASPSPARAPSPRRPGGRGRRPASASSTTPRITSATSSSAATPEATSVAVRHGLGTSGSECSTAALIRLRRGRSCLRDPDRAGERRRGDRSERGERDEDGVAGARPVERQRREREEEREVGEQEAGRLTSGNPSAGAERAITSIAAE